MENIIRNSLGLIVLAIASALPAAAATKPNIVFIYGDDIGETKDLAAELEKISSGSQH